MDIERFRDFMLEQAAQHEQRLAEFSKQQAAFEKNQAVLNESLSGMSTIMNMLVSNQVYLQESMDVLTGKLIEESDERRAQQALTEASLRETQASLRETQASLRETQASGREMHAAVAKLARTVDQHISNPHAHVRAS